MVIGAAAGTAGAGQSPPPAFSTVLDGKLHPPTARPEWIERPRLLRLVEQAADRQVLLVAAPAGYGKSTLVTQWVGTLDPGSTAWIYLDAGDNDPTRLWSHVAAALELVGCSVDEDPVGFVAHGSTAILTLVLPRVLERLAGHPRRLTLVLDDLQVVRNAECAAQLDYLIRRVPEQVQLVLISRSDPQLRLGRLRVEGKVAEVRTDDLAFTTDEIAAVLRADEVTLDEEAVCELARQTEGWPAAVYLAALSLAGRSDPAAFVRRLSGNNRLIADYLGEEVLGRQDVELRDFILDMSIFDRFNAALADHVTQGQSSARLLQRLERRNLFLIPLQGDEWFRFHHLFSTFARSALEVERPDRARTLHRRGAEFFSDQGYVEEAIQHLLAARDFDEAAKRIQANWMRFFDAGREATVIGWLRGLRGTPADTGPAAIVTAAWIAALTGNQGEMRRRLRELEAVLDDSPLPDGTKSPQSALVLNRAMFGFDGPAQMLADARRAVELESDTSTQWSMVALSALGYAGYLTGDVELARQALAEVARSPTTPATIRVLAVGTLALCEAEQGQGAVSARLAREAMDIVTQNAMQAMPQATFAATAYGMFLISEDRLSEAAAVLDEGLAPRRRVPDLSPWPLVHHLLAMAVVAARSDDRATAEALLAEIEELTPWTDESMAPTRRRMAAVRDLLKQPAPAKPSTPSDQLTPRELQILHRLRGSQTLREIAADLYVSHNTVKTITSSLYRKLGAHSRAEAVDLARRLDQR